MPSVEIDGAVELREAMRKFTPDLAHNLETFMLNALNPIVRKARGFAPVDAPLTQWGIYSAKRIGRFPWYNAIEVRSGIYATTNPSIPNRRGFSYAASIVNTTAAGSIYETAGRKNPNGRKQAPMVNIYDNAGTPRATFSGKRERQSGKRYSQSDNPNAGKQFIDALGPLYKVSRMKGQSGKLSRKMNGRLIYRAWGEDQGRVNGAILSTIDKTLKDFNNRTAYRFKTQKAA